MARRDGIEAGVCSGGGQLSILLYFSCRVRLYSDMVSRKQIYLLFLGIVVPDLKCRNLCENTKMNIEKIVYISNYLNYFQTI